MQMSNTHQVELEGINPNLENFKTNAGIGVRSMHACMRGQMLYGQPTELCSILILLEMKLNIGYLRN